MCPTVSMPLGWIRWPTRREGGNLCLSLFLFGGKLLRRAHASSQLPHLPQLLAGVSPPTNRATPQPMPHFQTGAPCLPLPTHKHGHCPYFACERLLKTPLAVPIYPLRPHSEPTCPLHPALLS